LMNNDEVIFAKPSADVVHPDIASISKENDDPTVIKDDMVMKEVGFFQKLVNWVKNLF